MTGKIAVDLIVFDLDGTLVDSLPDLAQAVNFACRTLGLPEHPREAVQGMIGGGERNFIQRVLGPGHQELLEEGLRLYLEYYSNHCSELTRLYPGVKETLAHLSHKKLAVLSNKLERLTAQVLRVAGILPYFTAVRGGGTGLDLKPSPAALLALIQALGLVPGRTLMVGDKPADILAGRAAGAHTAAVTYGYGDLAALIKAAPEVLIPQISPLREIIV